MKVFNGIDSYDEDAPTAITTGTFDGVHLGHKKILDRLNNEARAIDGKSVLVTFFPHPRLVLFPDREGPLLITSMEERIELLKSTGLDHLIIHPFTKEFSRTPALNYVRDLLVGKLHMQRLVIGYDHHFGRNREGSIEALSEMAPVYGFNVTEIPALDVDQVNVSSTKVRNALAQGDIEVVTSYLSYRYFLNGTVVKGHQRGRLLGFPTANLELANPQKIVPSKGVYAVKAEVDGWEKNGLLNIGVNPTFGEENRQTVEVHLLDFNGDIYGKNMKITFIGRLRGEMKFASSEELVTQMELDRERSSAYFQ